MINQIVKFLTGIIITVISSTGYLGVFGLLTAGSALIPIPSEVTMPFAGYLASTGRFNIFIIVAVGVIGELVGCSLAYWLGYHGGETYVRNFIKKYGKFVLVSVHELDRSERWFRKYGERIVLVSRMLPVVRTFISLPAGLAKMKYTKFLIFTAIGSSVWLSFLGYIGFTLGKNWDSLSVYYRKFEIVIVIAGAALVIYYVWHKISKVIKAKKV